MSTPTPSVATADCDAGPAVDTLFATETMAELSARQGRIADAVAIYRHLLRHLERSGTGDGDGAERHARWAARLAALECATLTPSVEGPSVRAAAGLAPASPRQAVPTPRSSGPSSTLASTPASTPAPAPALSPSPSHRLPLVVTHPVRSGQIVYAEHGDLIVLAPVNPGAQLLADGNIHVYSSLRGRAVAGARGAGDAQVFCLDLQAELVGVDTGYVPCEDIPASVWGGAARVWLSGGRCQIEPLRGSPAPGQGTFAINRARRI